MRRVSLYSVLVPVLFSALTACSKSNKEADPTPAKSASATPGKNASAPPGKTSGGEVAANTAPATTKGNEKPGPGMNFVPGTNGFKFENYGNDKGYENLTAAELRRMFGDKVCADIEPNGTCFLAPAADAWMKEQNKGMGGGHCEGMAALALLINVGKANAKDFGAEKTFDLAIDGNTKLQHEIAYWFVTQAVSPMNGAESKNLTPTDVVKKLDAALKAGTETYTLGVYQPGYKDGHATTAYGVVDKGNDISWILHYDNNFPGVEKHVEVNRKTNTWKYFTAANPAEPGMEYQGDASTFTLTLAPTSVRVGAMQCPFCGDLEPDKNPPGQPQVFLDGNADLLIADDSGHHLGHMDGKLVNDLPGGDYTNVKSRVLSGQHEPIYTLPTGKKLTMTLDGSVVSKAESDDVVVIGPGYTLGVYDVNLAPKQKDTLEFSADWREIIYKTQGNETPTIALGIETPGPDYLFDFKVNGEADGQQIDLAIDLKKGMISLQVHGKAGKTGYTMEMRKVDKGGEQVFKHKGLAVGSSEVLSFNYAAWKGNGQPMSVGVDGNHDGTTDRTDTITDEE